MGTSRPRSAILGTEYLYGLLTGIGVASFLWGLVYAWDRRELRELQQRINRLQAAQQPGGA